MPPAFRALLIEAVAVGSVATVATRFALTPVVAALAVGALGAAGALLWRMDRWWPVLLGAFPLAVWAGLTLSLPAWAWGVAALALVLAYGGVHRTQVPLFLSRRPVWDVVLAELPAPQPGARYRFLDLGSGLGGLPRHIGRSRPDVDADGVELAPLPVALGWLRQRLRPLPNVQLRRGDLWQEPVGNVDLAFAFLSPVPMPALWQRLSGELPRGALFISCEFAVPDVVPAATRIATDGRKLFLYRL